LHLSPALRRTYNSGSEQPDRSNLDQHPLTVLYDATNHDPPNSLPHSRFYQGRGETVESNADAMKLKIVQVGDPVLREQARALSLEEIKLVETQQLIEWMRDTMRDAPGVGLAAPQIGLPIQLAVIEDRPEHTKDAPADRERSPVPFQVLINPRIVERSEDQVEFFEGCLSLAGFSALVKRSRGVTVEYWDEGGQEQRIEAHGWHARILQHEIDHLHGRLYIDRMEPRSFTNLENLTRHWKDSPIGQIRQALRLDETSRQDVRSKI
jgi:peptide deformylase